MRSSLFAVDRRRWIAALIGIVGASAISIALLYPESDEEQIERVLQRLASAVSFETPIDNPMFFGSRLSEQFQDLLAEDVRVRVSEVPFPLPSHRGQLGLAAAQGLSRYGSLQVSLSGINPKINGKTAEVKTVASVMTFSGAQLQSTERPVDFSLSKADGDWRVSSVKVSADPEH